MISAGVNPAGNRRLAGIRREIAMETEVARAGSARAGLARIGRAKAAQDRADRIGAGNRARSAMSIAEAERRAMRAIAEPAAEMERDRADRGSQEPEAAVAHQGSKEQVEADRDRKPRSVRLLHQGRQEAEVEEGAEAGAGVVGVGDHVGDRLSAACFLLNFFTLSGI